MSDLTFMPAAEIAALIQHGKASATEAVDAYLAQIQRHNGLLNAIVTLDEDNARRRAKEADQALARGESCGTLHGVPITIKDSLETEGLRATAGFPPLSDHVPERDATVVSRDPTGRRTRET